MDSYADLSFLLALYLEDNSNHERAVRYMAEHTPILVYSPVARLDFRCSIRQKIHAAKLHVADATRRFALIEADLRAGFLVTLEVNHVEIFRRANTLSAKHQGSDAIDLLHVASALTLKTKTFLTFDRHRADLAKDSGITVHPNDVLHSGQAASAEIAA